MTALSLASMPPSIPSTTLSFSVVDRDCRNFSLVVDTFKKLIAPIYGSQETALHKIGQGADRLCEMLYDGSEPKALIVYKKAINERKALELKTLVVLKPDLDSGKGYGSVLISKIMQVAKMRFAQFIEVSVSSKKPEALAFFTKKGFVTHSSIPNFYQKGDTETFLYRDLRESSSSGAVPATSSLPTKTFISLPITTKPSSYPSSEGKTFGCTLKAEYVRQIQSGAKTFEGRIYAGPFRGYRVGDKVNWFAGQELRVLTEITEIRVFNTFEEMLTAVGFKKMLPLVPSFEAAVQAYKNIPGYLEKSRASGVVAFGVKPIVDSRVPTNTEGAASLAGSKRGRE